MRVLIGGVVGGLIIFFWGAIAHMATPLGMMGLSTLPAGDEPAVPAALQGAVKQPGFYFVPGHETGEMTPEQQAAWEAKIKTGPSGIMVVRPDGGEAMSPAQLWTELGSNVAAALLAAILLTRLAGCYPSRVTMIVLAGLMGWVSLDVSYWNWYGFPAEYIAGEAVMEVVGWLLAGLAMAAIVKPVGVKAKAEQELVAA